ncbi:MAG: hydrogenase nickel incorporation protein HypB [Clostridiales bacterium]|nr:hydrogenase nickel incorporation protein HypB [Clostridiales bacterium]MDY5529816.1 hydrogenase nickel incorporation protein HypB [Eubacteriales bacterium]
MKVIAVKESIFSNNDKVADELRASLQKKGAFMINVMSSPGSGKTTLLTRLINDMKSKIRIVAMDVDIETDVDARRIAENTGVESVQIHNGGLCHIDAQMVTDALEQADFPETDLIVLENIGNLVCPAEFDTGAHLNMMLLSVPEGDDKPLKYPLMFEKCDVVVVTKIDTLEAFDFDMKKFEERVGKLNKNARIFKVSAKTGEGIEALKNELYERIKLLKK